MKSQSTVEMMKLKMEASKLEKDIDLTLDREANKLKADHNANLSNIEIQRQKELSEIESRKMDSIINCLGRETLVAISKVYLSTN